MSEVNKVGRPSSYSDALADLICNQIAEGKSIRDICALANMPSKSTVVRWLSDKTKKEFWVQYAQARRIQYQLLADEIVEISNGAGVGDTLIAINRDRLKVDTRKWVLSKVLPKEYGDKVEATEAPVSVNENLTNLTDNELYMYLQFKRKINGDTN